MRFWRLIWPKSKRVRKRAIFRSADFDGGHYPTSQFCKPIFKILKAREGERLKLLQ